MLREYGGIYLDADIEVVNGQKFNQIIEELEQSDTYEAIIGLETRIHGYTAHSMAAKPNSKIAHFMCSLYENMGKLYHLRKTAFVAPGLVYLYFLDEGYFIENEGFCGDIASPIICYNVKIYPVDYFSPRDYRFPQYLSCYSENTCLCHHCGSSWKDDNNRYSRNKRNMQKERKMLKDYAKMPAIMRFYQQKVLVWLENFIKKVFLRR